MYNYLTSHTQVPFILVANKIDLIDKRQVSAEDGKRRAAEWKVPYMETSAKTKENVDKAYNELMRLIQARKNEENGVGSKSSNEKKKKKQTKCFKKKCVIL